MNIAYISLLKSVMEVYSHLNKEEIINIWKPESLNSRGKKVLKWLLSVTKLHLGHVFENSLNIHACTNKKLNLFIPHSTEGVLVLAIIIQFLKLKRRSESVFPLITRFLNRPLVMLS